MRSRLGTTGAQRAPERRRSCGSAAQQLQNGHELASQLARHARAGAVGGAARSRGSGGVALQAVACAADGEALFVQQLADTPDEKNLVMLVVAPVAAALDRLQLGELLLPVAQHVRLDAAQVAHLTDGEVAFGRDGGKVSR